MLPLEIRVSSHNQKTKHVYCLKFFAFTFHLSGAWLKRNGRSSRFVDWLFQSFRSSESRKICSIDTTNLSTWRILGNDGRILVKATRVWLRVGWKWRGPCSSDLGEKIFSRFSKIRQCLIKSFFCDVVQNSKFTFFSTSLHILFGAFVFNYM